jgi:hypothetical protein
LSIGGSRVEFPLVRELKRDNFGLLIAYILPGSVALWGASFHVEVARVWLQTAPGEAATIGGFLYATLASTALGLIISAVRWALVDRVLSLSGVRQPAWNFELFAERLAAYQWLVANHYRYYQFYANMLVALGCAYASWLLSGPAPGAREDLTAVGFVLIEVVLFAGARDSLRKYYERTRALLARRRRRERGKRLPSGERSPRDGYGGAARIAVEELSAPGPGVTCPSCSRTMPEPDDHPAHPRDPQGAGAQSSRPEASPVAKGLDTGGRTPGSADPPNDRAAPKKCPD